jgi:hypothetical protein
LPEAEARFIAGVAYCGSFFMDQADAQKALYELTAILEEAGLPYAIIGALALNEYGHRRVTVGVDLVMRDELHPWVRDRFLELWDLAQVVDPF